MGNSSPPGEVRYRSNGGVCNLEEMVAGSPATKFSMGDLRSQIKGIWPLGLPLNGSVTGKCVEDILIRLLGVADKVKAHHQG